MTKLMISIVAATVAIGLVVYGFVSGGMTQLIILIGVAVLMVGFAFYGLYTSNKRDDISNTSETSGWMG